MANPQKLVLTLSVPSTASTTTVGTAVPGFNSYDAIHGIASLQGLTGGTLDVYIQHSWDDGVTWWDCAHFTQVTAAASLAYTSFAIVLDSTTRTVGTGTSSTATPALAANTICAGPWAPLLRLVSVTGAGTSGSAKAQTVNILSWQSPHT